MNPFGFFIIGTIPQITLIKALVFTPQVLGSRLRCRLEHILFKLYWDFQERSAIFFLWIFLRYFRNYPIVEGYFCWDHH